MRQPATLPSHPVPTAGPGPLPVRHVPPSSAEVAGRVGIWVALATTAATFVSFGLAITAIPDAGPHCQENCASYPFTSAIIADQFPGDYLWMYPAMVLMLLFVALVVSIHEYAPPTRRMYSLLALCVAVLAAAVLLIDYFVQVTVMQPSLIKGQLDGWPMFTMYNPNGLFIAMEELGFLLMSTVFLCLSPVFVGSSRVERAIRWLFATSFAGTIMSLLVVSATYGIDRQDRFEVLAVSIVWLTLIVAGPLLAMVFRRANRQAT